MSVSLRFENDPKALGAFYTPETIADVLAQWVVRSGRERLLEPSVGEGALVKAAFARAEQIAGTGKRLRFLACDIDPGAIRAVRAWLPDGHDLRPADFFELDPATVCNVDGVIANPPFTRNHAMETSQRSALRQRFEIDGAAGLWVHFLIHACGFLAPNGRLAAIMPSASIFSNYGRRALERICKLFAKVEVRLIVDKPLWVNGAEERGAIILAEGYGTGSSVVPRASSWSSSGESLPDAAAWNCPAFSEATLAGKSLNSIASLSIGAVTGCNRVFLLNEQERTDEGVGEDEVMSIAARARHIPGLAVSSSALRSLAKQKERTWLLAPADLDRCREGARRRLARVGRAQRRNTVWLNKRTPWWAVDAGPDCDAVFTYMNDKGPRLVLAGAGVKCTNTLHRVLFHEQVSESDRRAAALSLVSTFGQLAAEQIGRTYGGGVLKFELVEARRLPVLLPNSEIAEAKFNSADRALKAGNEQVARDTADQALLPHIFGKSWRSAAEQMMTEVIRLRALRHGRERA